MCTVLAIASITPDLARAQGADDPPPPPPAAATPSTMAGERVTLPAKRLFVNAQLEIDLSAGHAANPIALAPDVYYGIDDKLTIGLQHSDLGFLGIQGSPSGALCFRNKCRDGVYSTLGVDLRYALTQGKVSLAINPGLYAIDLSPFAAAIKVGAVGRFRPSPSSKLAVDFSPSIYFALNRRDEHPDQLTLPGTLLLLVAPKITGIFQTGVVLPFKSGTYFVPLSLGGSYRINNQLTATAAFTLQHLLGGSKYDAVAPVMGMGGVDSSKGFNGRTFTLGVGYAL